MTNTQASSEKIELTSEQKEVLREAYRLLLSWARETPTQSMGESPDTQNVDNPKIETSEITNLAAISHPKVQL